MTVTPIDDREATCTATATPAAGEPQIKAPATLPPSVLAARAPGSFSAELWGLVSGPGGLFSAILEHPFLVQLANGTLPEPVFKFYVVQGALYLREYARALAIVASKAPRPDWVAFFSRCASEAYLEEDTFHKEFLAYFDTTVERETACAALAPYPQLYTASVLATVHEHGFCEGALLQLCLAAVLPCFIVYLEVGKALLQQGSRHALYQKFIDRFAGSEYEELTMQVAGMADAAAAQAGEEQRARMRRIFVRGCRMEWMFFEGCYRCQEWPV